MANSKSADYNLLPQLCLGTGISLRDPVFFVAAYTMADGKYVQPYRGIGTTFWQYVSFQVKSWYLYKILLSMAFKASNVCAVDPSVSPAQIHHITV